MTLSPRRQVAAILRDLYIDIRQSEKDGDAVKLAYATQCRKQVATINFLKAGGTTDAQLVNLFIQGRI